MAKQQKKREHKQHRDDDEINVDNWAKDIPLSPPWWAPTFVTLLIAGLIWLVVYYFSGAKFPIPGFGYGNLAVGIGLMLAGFIMTLRWR